MRVAYVIGPNRGYKCGGNKLGTTRFIKIGNKTAFTRDCLVLMAVLSNFGSEAS